MKMFITETELKTRLVYDLTQLMKFTKDKSELHTLILEIFNSLVYLKGNFRQSMGEVGRQLADEVLRDLGVNISQSGFIYAALRECTLLQAIKERGKYKLVIPLSNLEILSAETALKQEFLIELLYFLYVTYKSLMKRDLNSQEAVRFWTGVKTALINMLQVPVDERCYVYPLPSVILATQLLLLLSISQNVEHDASNVDAILLRLSFEISHLEAKEGSLVYAGKEVFPELDKRQTLCRLLLMVLTKSIKASSAEFLMQIGFEELLGLEGDAEALREELDIGLGENEDEEHFNNFSRRMRTYLRLRGRVGRAIGRMDNRPMSIERHREELEEEPELPANNENAALVRRVVESKVIELLNETIKNLVVGGSRKINAVYGPIVYGAISLIANILKNSPANIPTMVERDIIPNILKLFSKEIIPEDNCFCVILSALAAFVINEEGAAKVAEEKVLTNVFNILINPKYENAILSKDSARSLKVCANDIKFLYNRAAPVTKNELTQAIAGLFAKLNENGTELIKQMAVNDKTVNCKQYTNCLKTVGMIFYWLVPDSRSLRKLLQSLNKNNVLLKSLLNIERTRIIMNNVNPGCFPQFESSYNTSVIEFYLGEKISEGAVASPASVVGEIFKQTIKQVETTLGLSNEAITLGDFIQGSKTFSKVNDIINDFPDDKKMIVIFSTVEWICKSVRLFGQLPDNACDLVLTFVIRFHTLLLKEILRLYKETVAAETKEEIVEELKGEYETLKKQENDVGLEFMGKLLKRKNIGNYANSVLSLYEDARKCMPNLIKQVIKKTRGMEYEPRPPNAAVFLAIGRCTTKLLEETKTSNLSDILSSKEDSLTSLLKVVHNILVIDDLTRIFLINNSLAGVSLEFLKTKGFEMLGNLYQQAIKLTIEFKPQASGGLLESVKFLITQIVKIYCSLMDPSNVVQALKASLYFLDKSVLAKEGFSSYECYMASLLNYIMEGMLFKTKYGEYNTIIRFLAECVPNGFLLLLSTLENYSKKSILIDIFRNPRSSGRYYTEIMRRGEQEIPNSMISQLLGMGFTAYDSEDALRRNDLDVNVAVDELLKKKNAQSLETSLKMDIKKVDPKAMPEIIGDWLEYFTTALYESIYSISSYPCKYLLYSLSEFQAQTRPYKVPDAFALLLNELRTLLFSIELSYNFDLIPNDNFLVSELVEVPLTEKFKKRVQKYTAESSITEEELTVVHKMSALIDIITTFLHLSTTNELLKMMCKNKISQCLIIMLSKLANKDLIIPGRKLLPKVLVLLGMIYKEVHHILQGTRFKAILMENPDDEISHDTALNLLPNVEETKKLMEILCVILDMDETATTRMKAMQKSPDKKERVLVTTQVLTAIVLLLTYMTKDKGSVELVLKSKILQLTFKMKQVERVRSAIPSGLFKKLVFNILESPALLEEYMKRVISGILFAKTKYREKDQTPPKTDDEWKELQNESAIELNRFLQSTEFLTVRDMNCYLESCRKVTVLQKELKKDSNGKTTATHNLVLNIPHLRQMVHEANTNIPQAKLIRKKESILTNTEYKYAVMLHKGLNESSAMMKKTETGLLMQLLDHLINIQSKEDYVLPKGFLVELLGEIIKIYPETISLLLTYKNEVKPAVNGNKLISFLISCLFPQGHVSKEGKLLVNAQWTQSIISFFKALINCNPNLHTLRERVILKEMMKRIAGEISYTLEKNAAEKSNTIESQAQIYTSLTILGGLLVTSENSVVNPKVNRYEILEEVVKSNKNVINVVTEILKNCNFYSVELEVLLSPITNVLEWITRLNKLAGKSKLIETKDITEEPSKKYESEIYVEEYNGTEPTEINTEQGSIDADDEYLGEEEIKMQPKESAPKESQEILMPHREYGDDDSDENADDSIDVEHFRRGDANIASEPVQSNSELESVQVQISGNPIDRNEVQRNGMQNIYNADNDVETNDEIVSIMRGEVLGEEAHKEPESLDQRLRRMDVLDFDYYAMRLSRLEEDSSRQSKLPSISLFGDSIDKKKTEEVLKNQILGTLETITVEEKKPEVKKQEAKASESKEEVKEERKEEKKEQPGLSPADLANVLNSMISANIPQPEEKKAEEKTEQKVEEEKHEEEKLGEGEELKQIENTFTEALVQQRRQELARLVPGLQVEDDNTLLQIDLDFLRALPSDLRQQSVQQLITQNRAQNPPPESSAQGPAELDPATFMASIMDDNLRDEILLTATSEFLAALPPDMVSRASYLQQRSYFNPIFGRRERRNEFEPRQPPVNSLEAFLILPDKETEERKQLAQTIFVQTGRLTESCFETLIRLLYINTGNAKIPLNNLFSNLCCSKKNMYKLLNTLIFILSKHGQYEKYFTSKKVSTIISDNVSETKLTDSCFPPIYLYRGAQYNHLVNSIVSLRIFSLLSTLLNKPQVINYFFTPCTQIPFALSSITSLQGQLNIRSAKTPFEELLILTKDEGYTSSERHLEALINFINDLFNTAEYLGSTREDSKKIMLSVMSVENVRQVCQILHLEGMNDETFNKVIEILLKLSQVEENMYVIVEQIDKLVDLIGISTLKEWSREITLLDELGLVLVKDMKEELKKDPRTEIKLGRVLKLIKRLYDGHNKTEESPNKFASLYATEEEAIEDVTLSPKKLQKTESEEKVDQTRNYLIKILKKDILVDSFNVLTDLLSIISKKAAGENTSRKSQLLLKLMPAIEGLIISYDYCLRDIGEADKLATQMKEIRAAKPEVVKELGEKYKMAYVFYKFIEKNHSAFNNLIRQMSYRNFQLMVKPFIIRFPSLLDFENKRSYFRQEQKRIKRNSRMPVRVNISRDSIFNDSYSQLASIPVNDLKGRLRISFKGEEAADVGGVTREWYITLSKAMFNPIIGLFKKSAHGNTYQPDPKSVVEPNHLRYFEFIGRIIGKALLDGQYLECYFTRALYKTLVKQPLTIQDVQDYDPEIYQSLQWIRDNDVTEIDSTFSYTIDYFGRLEVRELVENGKNIKVTNENKQQFIMKMCKSMLHDAIQPQINALKKGLYELIPENLLAIFDSRELELMISGLPDIDLVDLRRNTEYHGYTENSEVIVWLWGVMETLSAKERAEFLQFVTGTSKVPLDGFKNLPGSSGIQKFQIHKVYGDADRLPSAHTWYYSKLNN